jgi:multidrug efflux pump subunit AcrA (membrane-fusion protein)
MSAADVAQAQLTAARAQQQQARAALHQVQLNLSMTAIRSPIDGVVVSRSVDVGRTAAASLQAPTIFTPRRGPAEDAGSAGSGDLRARPPRARRLRQLLTWSTGA